MLLFYLALFFAAPSFVLEVLANSWKVLGGLHCHIGRRYMETKRFIYLYFVQFSQFILFTPALASIDDLKLA